MKLEKKKNLAAKALGVGKNRIVFNVQRLSEIKEAITKQDIKDLYADKAIFLKEVSGRKKVEKRNLRRRAGKKRKNVIDKKREYIIITRKLRAYLKQLKKLGKISHESYISLRKEIRAHNFKTKVQLKEKINTL